MTEARPAGGGGDRADGRGARSRDRILAAAEEVFGTQGFEGGSLRKVADLAGVPVALVSHHFGSKSGLYRAVFEARAPLIVEQRMAGLALADLETDPQRKLELTVRSVLAPMLRLRASEHGRHFGTLLAREKADPASSGRGIVRDFFDPVALAVMQRLREALPAGDEVLVHWAYHLMTGALVYVLTDSGRISRLSDGVADPLDADATIKQLTRLILGGVNGTFAPSR